MLKLDRPSDLRAYLGKVLGHSPWQQITQDMITRFGSLTGDTQWIHVDEERSLRDSPDGKTIAHGLMIQSLAPAMMTQIYVIENRGRGLNYGYDRIRFITPVQVGDRIRLSARLIGVEDVPLGTKIICEQSFAIEGAEKLALVAENILLILNN